MKTRIYLLAFLLLPVASFAQVCLPVAKDTLIRPLVWAAPAANTFAPSTTTTFRNVQPIPRDFYARHLTFFCRQELKMQEAHVPISFRVGTMDQCNYLEQKPGYKIN